MSTTTKNITVKINAEIDKFNAEMKKMTKEIDKVNKDFEGLAKASDMLGGLGKKFLPLTAAVTGVGVASTATAMDFDSSMRQVAATMGYTSDEISDTTTKNGKDFEKLANAAREMGKQTKYSSSESAEALNFMALAGLDAEQSISLLPKVLNLASAGNMSLSVASDMVTDSMSSLSIELQDADKFIDSMAKTSQKSNTSVEQLGEAILTVGGTAKVLKGGVTEMNTVLGIFADNGIKGSEGGTALRNVIQSLSAPTDKAAGLMKELGLEAFDADGNMRPLNETFGDLSGILGKMTQEEQTKVLAELFNKTDLPAVNALLANCGDRFNELSSEIAGCDGAAQDMADTLNSGASGAITQMKSALEAVGEHIGQKFLPVVEKCADWVANLCNKFLELDPSTQEAIIAFGAVVGAIGPVLMGLGLVAGALKLMKGGTELLFAPLKLLSSKFGLAALAIIALIGVAVYLIRNWDDVKAKAKELADKIGECWNNCLEWTKEKWNGMWSAISEWWSNLISSIGQWFSDVGQWFSDGWNKCVDATTDFFSGLWNTISDWFNNLISTIGGWFSDIANWFIDGWNTCFDKTKEMFTKISDAVSDAFEFIGDVVELGFLLVLELFKAAILLILSPWITLWENCKGYVMPIFESIVSFVSDKLENIKTFVSEKLEAVKQFFTEKFQAVKDKTTEIYEAISNTISEKLEQAKTFVSEKLQAIATFFSDKWTEVKTKTTELYESISQVVSEKLEQAKNYVSEKLQAIANFFSEKWDAVKTKTSEIYQAISTTISEKLEQAKSYVSEKVETIRNYFSSKFESAKQAVVDKMNSIRQNIQDKINSAKEIASNAINTIKSKFDIFGTIASNVSSKFDTIKNKITEKVNGARDAVKKAVDKIKEFFNIKLEFPKIKIPVFGFTGKFSLNPMSVPSFGIKSWKWLNKGAVFKHKTVLPSGYGVGDKSFGGVGNNPEVVAPLDKLKDMLFDNKRQNDGGLTLNISEFNNNRDYDIEKLADELAYYLKRKQVFGGA